MGRREQKAVAVLIEEVESRTGRQWEVQKNWPPENRPVTLSARRGNAAARAWEILGEKPGEKPKNEGFAIRARAGLVSWWSLVTMHADCYLALAGCCESCE